MDTIKIGRYIATTTRQPDGAPFIDPALTRDDGSGRTGRGWAIVPPWRLRSRRTGRWRTATPCRALVLARLTGRP